MSLSLCRSYRLPQVSSWVVYAGIVTRSSSKMVHQAGYPVEKILYNKNYNHRSHDSDIALMKLRTPLNFSGQSRCTCTYAWLTICFLIDIVWQVWKKVYQHLVNFCALLRVMQALFKQVPLLARFQSILSPDSIQIQSKFHPVIV